MRWIRSSLIRPGTRSTRCPTRPGSTSCRFSSGPPARGGMCCWPLICASSRPTTTSACGCAPTCSPSPTGIRPRRSGNGSGHSPHRWDWRAKTYPASNSLPTRCPATNCQACTSPATATWLRAEARAGDARSTRPCSWSGRSSQQIGVPIPSSCRTRRATCSTTNWSKPAVSNPSSGTTRDTAGPTPPRPTYDR